MSRTPKHKPKPKAPEPFDDLTPAEEEDFALLVSLANSPEAKAGTQERPQAKTRVEFSQLATRARLVRFILAYFSGTKAPRAMEDAGISWGDVQIGRLCSPDFRAAFEFCERSHDQLLAIKAQARAEDALNGHDIGKGNASLVRFLLERLRASSFGDPRYLQGPTNHGGGGGVVYQITINQAASPQTSPGSCASLCGECVTIPAEAVKTAEKIPILCPNT